MISVLRSFPNDNDNLLGRDHQTIFQTYSDPQPIFIKKILLKHSHTNSFIIVCGCFCATVAELSTELMASSQNNLLSYSLTEKIY